LLGYFALVVWMPDSPTERAVGPGRHAYDRGTYQNYVTRTENVFKYLPDRVNELGIAPVTWAYGKYGLLGAGLGTGSQGAQYLGAMVQGAAEGGLGKIWLELGAPGFVIIVWLIWAMMRHIWNVLKLMRGQSAALSRLSCGLASFVAANAASFVVASQVYGDIFVLLLVGMALGALLAMPALAGRALQRQEAGLSAHVSDGLITQLRPPTPARNA
jgi:hypothetical protein